MGDEALLGARLFVNRITRRRPSLLEPSIQTDEGPEEASLPSPAGTPLHRRPSPNVVESMAASAVNSRNFPR